MKVSIEGNAVRIIGQNGVSLEVYAYRQPNGVERFTSSLIFNGMEHGCLPFVEVVDVNTIIIINNLEKGKNLYK